MVDVLTKIVIDCPREKVADYAADPDNAPDWYVKFLAPFMTMAMKRANRNDLRKIKHIVESKI